MSNFKKLTKKDKQELLKSWELAKKKKGYFYSSTYIPIVVDDKTNPTDFDIAFDKQIVVFENSSCNLKTNQYDIGYVLHYQSTYPKMTINGIKNIFVKNYKELVNKELDLITQHKLHENEDFALARFTIDFKNFEAFCVVIYITDNRVIIKNYEIELYKKEKSDSSLHEIPPFMYNYEFGYRFIKGEIKQIFDKDPRLNTDNWVLLHSLVNNFKIFLFYPFDITIRTEKELLLISVSKNKVNVLPLAINKPTDEINVIFNGLYNDGIILYSVADVETNITTVYKTSWVDGSKDILIKFFTGCFITCESNFADFTNDDVEKHIDINGTLFLSKNNTKRRGYRSSINRNIKIKISDDYVSLVREFC